MRKTTIAQCLLLFALFASMAANIFLWRAAHKPPEVRIERHVEWIEVKDRTPQATESHLTGDTMVVTAVVLPHRHASPHEPDMMPAQPTADSVATVSIMGDSATVTLPVEQRIYDDSLYTAYVSGYRPQLDSITLHIPHTYTTVTKTINKPARRWAIGPSVGVGYGIAGKQADVFVGITATFNLWP